MGLFGRLLGKRSPRLPDGARAYVDGYGALRDRYAVFYADGADARRVGPAFNTLTGAQMYADWVNGEGSLDWNVNGVGMPV